MFHSPQRGRKFALDSNYKLPRAQASQFTLFSNVSVMQKDLCSYCAHAVPLHKHHAVCVCNTIVYVIYYYAIKTLESFINH